MTGSDLLEKLQKLLSIDGSEHLLCEDETTRKLLMDCLEVFAYTSTEVIPWQEKIVSRIDQQLGSCDQCVVWYYRAKRLLIDEMRNDYDDDDVETFAGIIDDRDYDRIQRGLAKAVETLSSLPAEKKRQSALPKTSALALYEALANEKFISDDQALTINFDAAFTLVQTRKLLNLTSFLPAMTKFAFDPQERRYEWAIQNWSKVAKNLTEEDFSFAIREPLSHELNEILLEMPDAARHLRFWNGMLAIVQRLDASLITHSLRAMDQDVYRLALDHLQVDSPGLLPLLKTVTLLLEKSPKDFWEAMGAIAPTTVIEAIFGSSLVNRFMLQPQNEDTSPGEAIHEILGWISPFMASLQISHKPPACRALLFQLLTRIQDSQFLPDVRLKCYRRGLEILVQTLADSNDMSFGTDTVARVVAADTLGVLGDHIKEISSIMFLPSSEARHIHLINFCAAIFRNALKLEATLLRIDRERLSGKVKPPSGMTTYEPRVWEHVQKNASKGSSKMAAIVFSGIGDLIGLESFNSKKPMKYPEEQAAFNETFGKLSRTVCEILERVNDVHPMELADLASTPEVSPKLLTPLFSSSQDVFDAGVDVLKSLSGTSIRRDAIRYLMQKSFASVTDMISWSINRTCRFKCWAPLSRMLRLCTDVIFILCDSQDGLLRTQVVSETMSNSAVNFWKTTWGTIDSIYKLTPFWAEDQRTPVMHEFCRDVMQFSDLVADQFSVFDSTVSGRNHSEAEQGVIDIGDNKPTKGLLEYPLMSLKSMVQFLKLRDEYLLSISVKLVTKLLRELTSKNTTVPESTSQELERVAIPSSKARSTNMTAQQKAEILRALEENLGHPIEKELDVKRVNQLSKKDMKQVSLDMQSWTQKSKLGADFKSDILSVTSSVEKFKAQMPTRPSSTGKTPFESTAASKKPLPLGRHERHRPTDQDAFLRSREQAKREKKLRDAEIVARAKKNLLPKSVAGQTAGEGSALGKLGNVGKEHTPKSSDIMVSSETDTDSDDSADRLLFGMPTPSSSSRLDKGKSQKAVMIQKTQYVQPVKKVRQVRSQKDMRARVAPDLASLHVSILAWDFFWDGQFPPKSTTSDYSLVSNTFSTAAEYRSTFEALLLLEAWQSFRQAREEASSRPVSLKIMNRMSINRLVEVSSTVSLADQKDAGILEGDIILISKSDKPSLHPDSPNCLARVERITKRPKTCEILFKVAQGKAVLDSIVPSASLFGEKVLSIVPLEREYGALLGLVYFDLCDEIIKAYSSPFLRHSSETIEKVASNYALNLAQSKAVQSAMENDAFTLIQGPPGSGKTKTIVAIVGALLTEQLKQANNIPIARPAAPSGTSSSARAAPVPKKLLICAPSNAAVDELVMRLMQGVKMYNGVFRKISVLRLGRSENINPKVVSVTLDELVNKNMNVAVEKQGNGEDIHKIMLEHKSVCDKLSVLRSQLDSVRQSGQTISPQQFHSQEVLKRKKTELSNQIDRMKDSGNTSARNAEIRRNQIRQEIIDGAHVLCATLSGSGHDMFRNLKIDFETVIIDEAAQAIELSALIPLKYGCSKCIMVGDPKQLPPTVLSREAARFQYEQSLFVRMQANCPENVHLLDTQYRMHPEISAFPSQAFYDGKLVDGEGMAKLRARPWHSDNFLGPYGFFDVQGMHQSAPKGHSLVNYAEIDVATRLFERLRTVAKGYDFTGKIGIITPYKSQLKALRERFNRDYGGDIAKTIEFNTTDAFQGRESEVIIFSCVRASSKGIGFLSDIRRMNVGITRAKCSLWVLGNSASLMQGEFWEKMIEDALRRKCYTHDVASALNNAPEWTYGGSMEQFYSPSKESDLDEDIEMEDAFPVRPHAEEIPTSLRFHRDSSSSSGSGSSSRRGSSRFSLTPDGDAQPARSSVNSSRSSSTSEKGGLARKQQEAKTIVERPTGPEQQPLAMTEKIKTELEPEEKKRPDPLAAATSATGAGQKRGPSSPVENTEKAKTMRTERSPALGQPGLVVPAHRPTHAVRPPAMVRKRNADEAAFIKPKARRK